MARADPDQSMLERASRRARNRPFFLAGALAQFQSLHDLDPEQLAAFLGCAAAALPRLGLCRRPDPAALTFRLDVQRVAAHVGAKSEQLARLLREVDSVTALRRAPSTSPARGALLAARDRTDGADGARERGEGHSGPDTDVS